MKTYKNLANLKAIRILFITIMLFILDSSILMSQTTVTVYTSKDNSPDEYYPTTNYGSCDRVFLTGGTGTRGRGMFRFDLSSIPPGTTITSGTLYLYRILGTGSGNVNVHRIINDWTEGTAPCNGTVGMVSNWNQRAAGTNWTTAGGDFDSNVEASTFVSTTTYTTHTWDIKNLIQNWVNGVYPNNGLLIKHADESAYNQITFATREYTGTANDARLVITYNPSKVKTWTGNVSTDWLEAANWSPAGVPDYDTVIVPSSPSGDRFPVLSGPISNNIHIYTLRIESGATFTQNGSRLILHKNLIIDSGGAYIQDNGELQLYSDWINHGTFTSIAGWVILGDQTALSDYSSGINEFYDLSISTLSRPKFDNFPNSLIIIKKSLYNYGNYSASPNATFLFTGSEYQSIWVSTASGNAAMGNFVIDKSGGSLVLEYKTVEISGDFTLKNGIFDLDTCTFKRNTLGGTFALENNSSLWIGGNKSFPTGFSTINLSPTSTVRFYGTDQTVLNLNYGNLSLSGSGTKTFAGGKTGIAGNFNVEGIIVPPLTTNSYKGGNSGLLSSSSTLGNISVNTLTNNSKIDYNGSSDQVVLAIDYYDLTLSNAGTKYFGAGTVGIGGDLDIEDLAVANAIIYNDTIKYFGTDQNVRYGFVNKNLVIENESSVTALTNIHVTNSLLIQPAASLNMNNYILTVDGILLNNGNYISTNPAGTMSFYSRVSGGFNALDSWSNGGYTGDATTRLPGVINNDVLLIGDNKTINMTSNISNLGTLRIESTGALNPSNFVVSGPGEFDLRAGGTLIISSAHGLNSFSGNIQTEIQMYSDSANYEFNGNVPQITGLSFPYSVGSLAINNPTGVALSNNVKALGELNLGQGSLILADKNLTLGGSSQIIGSPSESKMIVASGSGQLRKEFWGAGSFTFPVGDNTGIAEYSPVTLNFTSGNFSSAYVGVSVVNEKHPQNSSTINYINRYWTISSSGISDFSCDVSLIYTDDDIHMGGVESNIFGGKYNGNFWTLLNPVNPILNLITAAVTSFSDFTGGESSALPVELTSFEASVKDNTVKLLWETTTEVNNYGFEVERSNDNIIFSKIGFVSGHGNTNSIKKYFFEQTNLENGIYYFRLKQMDSDGGSSFSNTIQVMVNHIPNNFSLNQNYPNPFNPTTQIRWQSPVSGWQTLKVYDVLGNEVAALVDEFRDAGFYEINFDASQLSSGVYIYKLSTVDFTETKKMILSK